MAQRLAQVANTHPMMRITIAATKRYCTYVKDRDDHRGLEFQHAPRDQLVAGRGKALLQSQQIPIAGSAG